jgi:uncharacterized protein (DUF1330 family)
MSAVLVIATLRFTDLARYRAYQARFLDVFRNYRGEVLAADESPVPLEGEAVDKVVVMRFPDRAAAEAFLFSDAYQEISQDRRAGAETSSWLVKVL